MKGSHMAVHGALILWVVSFDDAMAVGAVRRARVLGVNFFDTAQVSRLIIAGTLANPAVHVAIAGARRVDHVQDSLPAANRSLSEGNVAVIDIIMAAAAPVSVPSPEAV